MYAPWNFNTKTGALDDFGGNNDELYHNHLLSLIYYRYYQLFDRE